MVAAIMQLVRQWLLRKSSRAPRISRVRAHALLIKQMLGTALAKRMIFIMAYNRCMTTASDL